MKVVDYDYEPFCNRIRIGADVTYSEHQLLKSKIKEHGGHIYISDSVGEYRIKDVIFHPPATIVLWEDGTKTVVKLHDEPYDAEKGLAMAVMKKVLGTEYRKYVKKAELWNNEACTTIQRVYAELVETIKEAIPSKIVYEGRE